MLILETSWEVCNKQGGIYTVLSSRAREMMKAHNGQVIFVGPLFEKLPQDFVDECPEFLMSWVRQSQDCLGLPIRVGRWDVPGQPAVVLVDFSSLWADRGQVYYDMWCSYGIESDKGYGDYDNSCLFAVAATRVMGSIVEHFKLRKGQSVAIYNEWQTAMGLLYSKRYYPKQKTMFITHATTVGRSIAGNGKELYAHLPHYYGDQMAEELGVVAKHAVEKQAALQADIFATVSELTAQECTQLIGRSPQVLPNGFEPDFVPRGRKYDYARREGRQCLCRIAKHLTGLPATERDVFISLGGRYEYRNKGIDLFVESIARLRIQYRGKKRIFAFVLVPAWVAEPRADLKYLLEAEVRGEDLPKAQALQHPSLTHWLNDMAEDPMQKHLGYLGLDRVDDRVNIIQIPVYLTGQDGIANKTYYELLCGMDLTIYPSYYEPWGYTPLESIAFGIPTITTTCAGFGLWAEEELKGKAMSQDLSVPVQVLLRNDYNTTEVVKNIVDKIERYTSGQLGTNKALRRMCFDLATRAEWKHFYKYYLRAYKTSKPKV